MLAQVGLHLHNVEIAYACFVLQGEISISQHVIPVVLAVAKDRQVVGCLCVLRLLSHVDRVGLLGGKDGVLRKLNKLLEIRDSLVAIAVLVHEKRSVVVIIQHRSDARAVNGVEFRLNLAFFIRLVVSFIALRVVNDSLVQIYAVACCVERLALCRLLQLRFHQTCVSVG